MSLNTGTASAVSSPAAETLIASSRRPDALPSQLDVIGATVRVSFGSTPGTGATAYVVKCYSGTAGAGGTQIGATRTIPVTAAQVRSDTLEWPDAAGLSLTNGASFTIAETGATVAGTVGDALVVIDAVSVG